MQNLQQINFRTAGRCLVGHSKDVEYKEVTDAVPRALFTRAPCKNWNKWVSFYLWVRSEGLTDLGSQQINYLRRLWNSFHQCCNSTHGSHPIKANSSAGYSQIKHSRGESIGFVRRAHCTDWVGFGAQDNVKVTAAKASSENRDFSLQGLAAAAFCCVAPR